MTASTKTNSDEAAHDRILDLLEAYDAQAVSRSEYVGKILALIERERLEAKIEECGDWAAEMGLRELSNDRSRLTREVFLGRTDELRALLAASGEGGIPADSGGEK